MDSKKSLGPAQKMVVGVQFLFVAFGATVLVPLLVGLDPSTALFTAGLGTLIFHLVTKGKVPIFWEVASLSWRPSLKRLNYMVYRGQCRDWWLSVLSTD